MHDTAYRIGGLVIQIYAESAPARILEIGSQDINGTLRDFAPPTTIYLGLDLEAGPGVDMVMVAGKPFPVEDASFDLVMATSVFEHDPSFWITFLEMCRKAKAGGYIYISAPSSGLFHQYPQDHWRFYPDCGLALVAWAKAQGEEVSLVESFIAEREGEIWNDFVAVFKKGPLGQDLPARLICEEVPCTNARTWRGDALERRRDETEDMTLMKQMGDRAQRFAADQEELHSALEIARQELADAQDRVARLESILAQRQEEITQAWAELSQERGAREDVRQALDQSERKLAESDAWVFRLAGDRQSLETRNKALERKVDEIQRRARATEAALETTRDLMAKRIDETLAVVSKVEAERDAIDRRMNERFREIATLTNLLAEREGQTKKAAQQTEWLRETGAILLNGAGTRRGRWRALLPAFINHGRQRKILENKGLFDGDAYLKAHPDVAAKGMDPLRHYIAYGMKEGRRVGRGK